MRVLVTGANGFLGSNLVVRLREQGDEVVAFTRDTAVTDLPALLDGVDFVVHLAGVNRPRRVEEFEEGNADLTARLVEALSARPLPVLYSSSIQADRDNPYGASKRRAEQLLQQYGRDYGVPVSIYRLPNVFGKWCRPNYNSVVATFCHNIARGLPIQVNDPDAPLRLVYIDDVIEAFLSTLRGAEAGLCEVAPEYSTTVGALASQIRAFTDVRDSLITEPVGAGLTRALYATYLSHLAPAEFSYEIPQYRDERGVFSEVLKTRDSGQFSYFTAHPGVTRGGHYHHSKTEKFLVVKGEALFKFRHILSDERYQQRVCASRPTIVETIPGWAHDITNVGDDELLVLLWANEVFDRQRPDTIQSPV
ncbi:UDP-2-acetamido-2,6-beta-L-arabino-hexul-4-ose reductase [Alkalilimnicola sp. S0819]|uniref:UDP-2-acetamido-2,6-beta-L-arabino-hexul-4-ose reductase n=1 Tax=Alkalilimnicola sp. S0819 TaxID=2613922 RepID=UPI001262A8B8|nr:capsular polysaccharide biosynthesis protein CapF [Alkalilimnicola sp. S0819]KAB7628249.1 capsular polysaccharide biosynthesis protein CapF [Alkalilimnicola sp. S0819]MPQ15140.1 NAD-dependent epimerase/dehydratase family protein [Alkalilimnicola sp. S0819]